MASFLSKPSFFTGLKTSSAFCPSGTLEGALNYSFPVPAFALSSLTAAADDDDAGVCVSGLLDLDRCGV